MSSEDVGHAIHKGRQAVTGFAEFCSESSEGCKVTCTNLQYTYPVRYAEVFFFFATFYFNLMKLCYIALLITPNMYAQVLLSI